MHQRDGFEFRLNSSVKLRNIGDLKCRNKYKYRRYYINIGDPKCRRHCGKHLAEPGGVVMDTAEHLLSALLQKIPH